MDNQEQKGRQLNAEEEQEWRDGNALYEMDKINPGWQIAKKMLEAVAYHSWVDPRGMKKEDWEFAELNAFHAANNAKEFLDNIQEMINKADYLGKVKNGEIQNKSLRV